MGSRESKSESPQTPCYFADAVIALEDERAISVRDERANEERWITIGMDSLGRILVVV